MFKRIVKKLIDARFVTGPINRNDRAGALHRAWGHVVSNHMRGDYFEFGVYKGDSFVESYKQYQLFRRWLNAELVSPEPWRRKVAKEYVDFVPKFYGLDTFAGMPSNDEGNVSFATGTFESDLSAVKRKCDAVFPAAGAYTLYKGLFNDTAADLMRDVKNKAAIINVDCDIYESARDALRICSSLLQVGTVVLLDDYNAFSADNQKGERRAFREFQETSGFKFERWFPYQLLGQAYLCVGKA